MGLEPQKKSYAIGMGWILRATCLLAPQKDVLFRKDHSNLEPAML